MATVNNPYCLEAVIRNVERRITVRKALEILQSNQPPLDTTIPTADDWRAAWDKAVTQITAVLLDEDNLA